MRQKTVGELLQEVRLAHSISLSELAKATRIRVEYLKALEANEFSQLPAATFVKAYINNYARVLDFDPEPLIRLLRRDFKESAQGQLVPTEFLTPLLRKQVFFTPITTTVLSLAVAFLTVLAYVGFQWYKFQQPPDVSIAKPEEFQTVGPQAEVRGTTAPDTTVIINEQPIALQPDGSFAAVVSFQQEGLNTITVQATDPRGKVGTTERYVQVDF